MPTEAVENAPARIALVVQLLHTMRVPLNALATHSTHPEQFPVERVQEAGPAAVSAAANLKRAIKLLAPMAGDATAAAPQAEELDLADLATLESLQPEYALLLQALSLAKVHAENIDQATGNAFPDKIGGSCGYDLAEDITQLSAKVALAAGLSKGKGLE